MLKIAYSIYIFALVVAPVALGATHLWAITAVETAAFAALFFVLFDSFRTGRALYKVPAILPCAGFVLWIGLQLIPLPSGLLAWISPATHAIYATVHGPAEPSFWAPLTIKPLYTVQELFRWAAFVAFYFLSVQLLADRQRLKQTLAAVMVLVGVIAFQGVIQAFAGNGKIYWFVDPGPDAFFGPFFYRNHYAGFMAMLLPVAVALFLYYRPQSGDGVPLRQKIVHLIEQLKQSPSFRYGLISIFLFASILLSQSRTGISMAVLTTGGMLLVSRKLFRLNRTSPALIALLVVLAALFIGRTGLDRVDARFGEAVNAEGLSENGRTLSGRTSPWQDCLDILGDFPLTGSGLGTFYAIYPSYKTVVSETPLRQAHNEYIETATDGGLIAVCLVGAFLVFFFRQNYGMFRLRRDRYAKHLYIGSLTGLIALLLHSVTDYQFRQTAAVPLYFFFLLGVHTVGIHSRRSNSGNTCLLPDWSANKAITMTLCGCMLALLSLGALFNSGQMLGMAAMRTAETSASQDFLNLVPDASPETLQEQRRQAQQAAGYDPLNPIYPTASAYIAQRLGMLDEADLDFRQALLLDPVNANILQLYGVFLSGMENRETDAERLLQASVVRDKNSKKRLLFYVYWLLGQGDLEKGIPAAQEMLNQYPDLAPSFMAMLQDSPLPAEIIPQSLPERVAPRLAYAALLENKGDQDGAAAAYDLALSYMDKEEIAKPSFFQQPLGFYSKQKNEDRILAVLQLAVVRLPNEFSFRLQLGDLYAAQGMHRKAADEYRFALQLKPGDRQVQQRLDTLTTVLN